MDFENCMNYIVFIDPIIFRYTINSAREACNLGISNFQTHLYAFSIVTRSQNLGFARSRAVLMHLSNDTILIFQNF